MTDETTNEPPGEDIVVAVELLVTTKLHQQMVQICKRRGTSLNETLLELIDRFMPPDTREEPAESKVPAR